MPRMVAPQACMELFIAALIRKDIDAALPLLTDDVALFYSNGTAIWGKDAFAASITANWKRIERYHYQTDESIWLAESDTAAGVIYTFSWSGVAGGQEVSGNGRGTRLFRREADGWRIAHEHLSTGQWKPTGQ
jgi:ketosteroid isomerase-like protein